MAVGATAGAIQSANYRMNLDRHILPLLGRHQVSEIRPRLVASFLVHLADKGLASGTVRKVRTVLSAVMSYAVAMEYVESNPVMKVPPPELDAEERVAPTLEETAALMLAAERHDPEFLTYLWVAAEEGGRRGETLALRWGCVDFETGVLTIDATITRGDFVFSGGVGSRRHPLDGQPWDPSSTTRRFRRLKELAGVRAEVDLHGLRHTMITELLAAGVDPRTVMGRAGHSSETMTMKVYAKVRPSRDAAAAELWGTMLRDKLADLQAADAHAHDTARGARSHV